MLMTTAVRERTPITSVETTKYFLRLRTAPAGSDSINLSNIRSSSKRRCQPLVCLDTVLKVLFRPCPCTREYKPIFDPLLRFPRPQMHSGAAAAFYGKGPQT